MSVSSTNTTTIKALRNKIKTFLDQAQINYQTDDDGVYAVTRGTAVVFISPLEADGLSLVQLASPVAKDITRFTSDLAFFLAEENNKLLIGKFSLDIQNCTVWYEHVMLGDHMQAEELVEVLEIVASTADQYDEYVSESFRGKRAIDWEIVPLKS